MAGETPAPMRNAVVLVADDRLFPAAAFAARRMAGLNPRDDTDIFVFTDSARELQAAPSRNYPFKVVPIVPPDGIDMPPTFFRIVIPAQMMSRYGRVLYIDVDTYVEKAALFALFDLDLRGNPLAAVRDYIIATDPPDELELIRVFGNRHRRYFNAGVLLIDCRRYAELRVAERVWRAMKENPAPMRYHDQSLLNLVLDGNFLELSPAFNMFISAEGTPMVRACPPVVTHFAGTSKPWMGDAFAYAHRSRVYMERFFAASPWPGFIPPRRGRPPATPPKTLMRGFRGVAPMARYLRETEFADVTAGLTRLHLEALPPAPASA